MNYEEDHQERYADRKKKSQRMDLESLKQRLFPGEGDRFEQLLKEYRLIQKERRNDIPIDESAINPINEHKNRISHSASRKMFISLHLPLVCESGADVTLKLPHVLSTLTRQVTGYPDVLPFKDTAVKLQPIEGVAGSEYINANFVTDLSAPPDRPAQKFICCQAPLVQTFNDFWRMVWEQHAPLIIMITNLVEGNKIKADTYWPTRLNQTLRYDVLPGRDSIRGINLSQAHEGISPRSEHSNSILSHLEECAASHPTFSVGYEIAPFRHRVYILDDETPTEISGSDYEEPYSWRNASASGDHSGDEFSFSSSSSEGDLEPIDGQEVRKITQLHCTKWPDFGVPESAQVMKDLVYELELRKRSSEDPVVIHCSAGIGRTGTFVAIHQALQKDLHGESISIRDIVRGLRNQRIGMVQSKEQYIFLYSVVSEMLRDRESLLNLHSKKSKRMNFIPRSRGEQHGDVTVRSFHGHRHHNSASTLRRRDSSANHSLAQSSPFNRIDVPRKNPYFHEKIIDHSLNNSMESIPIPAAKQQVSTQVKSSSANDPAPTSHERPLLRSRESSPQLKVSSSTLAKASTLEIPKLDLPSDRVAKTLPRGRSMPFLIHRSQSEDALTTPTKPSLASSAPRGTVIQTNQLDCAVQGSLPSSYSDGHHLHPPPLYSSSSSRTLTTSSSLAASGRHSIGDEELSRSTKSQENRSTLRMASDTIAFVTSTQNGNSSPDMRPAAIAAASKNSD